MSVIRPLLGTHDTKTLFGEGKTLPTAIVIDQEGNVRKRIEGVLPLKELEEKMEPLIQ